MPAYIASYDLKKPGQDYKDLIAELKNSPKWWHYLESTWLLVRNESSVDSVAAALKRHMDDNDRLLVMNARRPAGGWLPQEAWDWINENIPWG
jgi:hypothetical protein